MQPRLQVSRAAIELIKRFEGLRLNAAQLEDGRWTIGYGHTLTARQGASVSEADAEALLQYDLIAVAHEVNEHVYAPLNQNQFDALCAFAFNVGLQNFRRSAALRRLNEGGYLQAAAAMELWRKADFEGERIVIDALVRRRAAEKTLFLTPPGGWVAAPSAVLPPKIDYDGLSAIPVQTPRVVETSLDQARAVAESREAPAATVPVEDEPSPSEIAAAAVTARLEALFPDEPEALAAAEAARAPPDAEPVFTLTPPDETEELTGEPATAVPPTEAAEPEPDFFEEPTPAPEAVAITHFTPEGAAERAPAVTGRGWLTIAYAIGMIIGAGVLIVGGAFGYLNRDDPDRLPFALGIVAFAFAILLIGTAAYMLLRLAGGPDDEDDEAS